MTKPPSGSVSDRSEKHRAAPVSLAVRLAEDAAFKKLFESGMTLIEETAAYLDGAGRTQSRHLSQTGTMAYASESMRLTTRLMQLASWLLLQRAMNEGDMESAYARDEKAKIRLGGLPTIMSGPGWEDLPVDLQDLILRSFRLEDQVRHLDEGLGGTSFQDAPKRHGRPDIVATSAPHQQPIADYLTRLEGAFGPRGS